jgi:hypothetical protein
MTGAGRMVVLPLADLMDADAGMSAIFVLYSVKFVRR